MLAKSPNREGTQKQPVIRLGTIWSLRRDVIGIDLSFVALITCELSRTFLLAPSSKTVVQSLFDQITTDALFFVLDTRDHHPV